MFEQSVIGAILLTNGRALREIDLTIDDFNDPNARRAYKRILDLDKSGAGIDLLTVTSGASVEIFQLLDSWVTATPTANNIEFYAGKVREAAIMRRLNAEAESIIENKLDPTKQLAYSKAVFEELLAGINASSTESIGNLFDKHLANVTGRPPQRLGSGWTQLNDLIGGFRPGSLTIIGARPATGKTVVGLQLAYHLAQHGAVTFHSLEMSEHELMNRLLASTADVELEALDAHWQGMPEARKNGDVARINKAAEEIKSRPLFIADKSGQSIHQVRAYITSVMRKQPVSAVVIDYLGLMRAEGSHRSRYEATTEISNGLKALAKDLQLPVIALAQLNRDVDKRGGEGFPTMADLRDSGSIEQDADTVILLHREKDNLEILHLGVAKNRHGRTGKIELRFEGAFARVR